MGILNTRVKIKEAIVIVIFTLFCSMSIYIILNKLETKQIVKEGLTNKISSYTDYEEFKVNEDMIVITYSIAREKPDEYSSKVCTYNKGDKIRVISKLSNNWYKVEADKNIVYIKCENVRNTKEVFIDNGGIIITSVKPDNTIEADGNITSNIINYAYNYWYLVPENIRNDFKEQGWKIVITDKSLSEELGFNYEISGATIPNDKTIMIYGSQSCIRYALIHEVGHYIDFRSNFISRSESFVKLYKENGSEMLNYNSNYNQESYSEEEYFAELYRTYIIGDYKLKLIFSNDINFVSNISNSI